MRVQIHKPLWGGFPKHWASGPVSSVKWTDDEGAAANYTEKEAAVIERRTIKDISGVVVQKS